MTFVLQIWWFQGASILVVEFRAGGLAFLFPPMFILVCIKPSLFLLIAAAYDSRDQVTIRMMRCTAKGRQFLDGVGERV